MASWRDAPLVSDGPSLSGGWQSAPLASENGDVAPITADTLMELARQQFTPPTAEQPRVEGNPMASSLPGPLGQFQNSSTAFQRAAMEGMTGNFSNEIASGVMAPIDAVVQATQGNGFDVGRSFNDIYQQGNQSAADSMALNPGASRTGNLTGGVVLGSSLAPLSPMARASTPLGMVGTGALEGGAYGAIYGAGGAEGGDRLAQGAIGGGTGALAGGAIGGVASALLPKASQEARLLAKGMGRDNITPASIPSRMSALGPDGVLADLGPNMQGQAAAIATIPGRGADTITTALRARQAGANDRIRSQVNDTLGLSPRVSAVLDDLDLERQAVNTKYEPAFAAKALSNDPFMDAKPIVDAIDNMIPNVVGKTRTNVERVRNMLINPTTGRPTMDPQVVMAVRQELDGMIGAETNTRTAGVLSDLRKAIDADLGVSVPGLKDIDAQFAEVARQKDALERGSALLNDGKTAQNPADLIEDMLNATPGQNLRLSQGARADIERIIGTKANDRVALRGIVRGDGSWNYEKLGAVFGKDKADELMAIVDREAKFAELENLATSGSRTQVLNAAQSEIKGNVSDPSVIREALNFQYGNAAGKIADNLLGGMISKNREGVVNRVAEALMGKGLTPKMQSEVQRLIDGMTPNEKAIISALQASQASAR